MNVVEAYFSSLQETINRLSTPQIEATIDRLHEARIDRRQVFIMGNGGSASTASHFACDLAKNTRLQDWPSFRVIPLTDNMAIFSAYANDEGYDNVFVQPLANFLEPQDIVIGISTSGHSPNVLNAIQFANEHDAFTIGFTGFDGGRLGEVVDLHVHVPTDCIEQVEDVHLILEHLICTALRDRIQAPPLPRKTAVHIPEQAEG